MSLTHEQRVELGRKGAAARAANKAAASAAAHAAEVRAAIPDPPPNYGVGRESRGLPGGAIDPATRDIGVDLGAKLSEASDPRIRPMSSDVVGDMTPPARPPVKVAKSESDLPFKDAPAPRRPPKAAPKSNGHSHPATSIVSTADENPYPVETAGTMLQLPDWNTVDLQEGQDVLDATYKLLQDAAKVLQMRVTKSEEANALKCEQCGKLVPDLRQAKMIQSRQDPVTGIFHNVVWCSHRCFISTAAAPRGVPTDNS